MKPEPLGTPDDVVNILDINSWGTIPSNCPSLLSSCNSSFKGSIESGIRNTIVTDSLIIHELDNRLLDAAQAEENVAALPSQPDLEDDTTKSDDEKVDEEAEEINTGKHFQVNGEINDKISFWCGNIAKIEAEGCVCSCIEMLRQKQPSQMRELLKHGSLEFQQDVFNAYRCTTGEAIVLGATLLPIRHIILTAGPKYNARYVSAAENTLYGCYRNAYDIAMDHKIETLTIGKIHNKHKAYPVKDAVHIALRTTRRYLEKHHDRFKKICFVLESSLDLMHYQELFPYYFPRNSSDYKFQLELPDCIGGEYGEPIRDGQDSGYIKAHWSTSSTSLAKKLNVTRSDFSSMRQDPDSARLHEQSLQPDVYTQLLQWSRTEDLSRIAKCRAVYHSGFDVTGVPVVVCVGKHFPSADFTEHKILSHFISVMDPATTRPYCLVYFHTGCTGPRRDLELLQALFLNSPARYKTNLKALYSLHATRYQKVMQWWFTVSKVKQVKGKIVQFGALQQLFLQVSPEQLQVPQFILDYDYKLHGATAQ